MVVIENSWKMALKDTFESNDFQELSSFIRSEYEAGKQIYPAPKNIFRAYNETPLDDVSVVILGQDPYHGPGQAQGLSFSVPAKIQNPPSLQNIFKEIENDIGSPPAALTKHNGDLSAWAKQGVLLLNSVLTVERGKAGSHANIGWDQVTDGTIQVINGKSSGVVFLLWGGFARKKKHLIDSSKHLILEAPHPSPLSAHRGFFGCKHFSKTNEYLSAPIEW